MNQKPARFINASGPSGRFGIQKLAGKSKSLAQRGTKTVHPRKALTPALASNKQLSSRQREVCDGSCIPRSSRTDLRR